MDGAGSDKRTGEQRAQRLRLEGRVARQQIVESGADRIDVGANVERVPSQLFRRCELRRGADDPGFGQRAGALRESRDRQAEIADLDGPIEGNETVRSGLTSRCRTPA